jgi:hypothetical protein
MITQPVHILPCNNSAMKCYNKTSRILYHDIAAQTITEPPPCFTVGTRHAFWIVGFLGCSPNVNSSWCREQHEGRLIWSYHTRISSCLIVWSPVFMVVRPSFKHLSNTFKIGDLATSPTADVEFVKLTSDGFCGNRVFRMNIQFCCHLCCSSFVIFETILLNARRTLSVSVDFRPLFLFADIAFPWFVYADITLETIALDTPNKVAVLSQIRQLNTQQRSVLFQNRTSLPFSNYFTQTVTQNNH